MTTNTETTTKTKQVPDFYIFENAGEGQQGLETEDLGEIARAAPLVPRHPTKKVRQAMIARLRKHDDFFVPVAMTMLEVFAGADSWAERSFLFRIKEEGPQSPLMKELLERVKPKEGE